MTLTPQRSDFISQEVLSKSFKAEKNQSFVGNQLSGVTLPSDLKRGCGSGPAGAARRAVGPLRARCRPRCRWGRAHPAPHCRCRLAPPRPASRCRPRPSSPIGGWAGAGRGAAGAGLRQLFAARPPAPAAVWRCGGGGGGGSSRDAPSPRDAGPGSR